MSKLNVINADEKQYTDGNCFIIYLGIYGWTRCLVYAKHLEDALEIVGEWAHDNASGFVYTDSDIAGLYNEALEEINAGTNQKPTEEQECEAFNQATESLYGVNGGQYYLTAEWSYHENPSKSEIISAHNRS